MSFSDFCRFVLLCRYISLSIRPKPAKALSLYPRYRIVYEHRQPRHNKRLIAEKNADGWSSRKPPDSWSAAWKRFAPSLTAKAARYCSVSPTRENHRTRRERQTKRDIADAIRRIEPFATVEVSYTEIPDTGKVSSHCLRKNKDICVRSLTKDGLTCGWKARHPSCRRRYITNI